VYNLVDYSDWTADRAKAAVELVGIYNGEYRDNVVIQAKFGPIDFQVREPVNPIFGILNETNSCIELEVAQEYLGQQDHVVYLPPLWQTIFQFDMRVNNETSLTRDLFTGKYFNRPQGGSAAVVNVGLNQTWLGSHMAMSNLYAYGRLAWDNTLDSQEILEDWTRLTFSFDSSVVSAITDISMSSWPAYENYSGNLGVQTLTDILYTHYGPNAISQEYNGYGQWFRIMKDSIGMDRTCFNGMSRHNSLLRVLLIHRRHRSRDLLLWSIPARSRGYVRID
jgi:alpha-glucuronidase